MPKKTKAQNRTDQELRNNKVPEALKKQQMDIEKKNKEIRDKRKAEWARKSRLQKLYFGIAIFLFIAALVALFIYIFARQIFGDEIGDCLFTDADTGIVYKNGFTWLLSHFGVQLLGTLITVFVVFLVMFMFNATVNVFMQRSKKSRTVGAVLKSAVRYVAIIVGLCIILAIWGVDIASIIAGLGVLTLVIGLGCQSLVNDIVSGLFIVFDNYFEVGDMVIIDGFRGNVTDIGLRTIKLNDGMGNQKSITNSSINTCVNLSRYPNLVYVTMSVSYNEDLEHVEAVIAKELPELKKLLPQIMDGPFYKGVDTFGDSSIDLGFACTCDAADRFQLRRNLQREIYQMLVRNGISIPFPQIVINPVDPQGRKATAQDVATSQALNAPNRAAKPKEEKHSFLDTFISHTLNDDDATDDK